MIVSISCWVTVMFAIPAGDGADELAALVPPTLDGVDDSVAVVCANSHALRVAERVAVAGEGAGLNCAVLKGWS